MMGERTFRAVNVRGGLVTEVQGTNDVPYLTGAFLYTGYNCKYLSTDTGWHKVFMPKRKDFQLARYVSRPLDMRHDDVEDEPNLCAYKVVVLYGNTLF